MKILHIVAGKLSGGAGRGAYWLHQALIDSGIESLLLTNTKENIIDEHIININKNFKERVFSIVRNQIDQNISHLYKKREKLIFSTGLIGFDFTKLQVYKDADIIHLHWINSGMLDIKILQKIKKPVIWTMRDMWPMTGGCHYTMGCTKFLALCGECQQLHSSSKYDLSRLVLQRKLKYLPKTIKIVGISSWLSNEAKKSSVFQGFDIRTIDNNVNSKEFLPIDKKIAREILGIKTKKKIILVGASNLKDFYKGFNKYLEALKLLDKQKYFLCFFGNSDTEIFDGIGFEYRDFGFLNDTISLRLLYSCADVFVAPSLMEAFGKTIVESMSCKTPVVCFDATGPKDIVRDKIDGYKAKAFSSRDLASGIEWIVNLDKETYTTLCSSARERVEMKFDSYLIAQTYINLYKEVLNGE